MAKHDESRRAFLVGAAVGAGAVAGTTMVSDALAQHRQPHPTPVQAKRPAPEPKTTGAVPAAHAGHDGGGAMARSSTTRMPQRSPPSPSG